MVKKHEYTGKTSIFTKLESWRSENNYEIFCEIFAAYMLDECIDKENILFMKNILKLCV